MQVFNSLAKRVSDCVNAIRTQPGTLAITAIAMLVGYFLAGYVVELKAGQTVNQFGAKVITVAALAVFGQYLFFKFFGKYPWVTKAREFAVLVFSKTWTAVLMGGLVWALYALTGSTIYLTMQSGIDWILGWLNGHLAVPGKPDGYGWGLVSTISTIVLILALTLRASANGTWLKRPFVDRFTPFVFDVDLKAIATQSLIVVLGAAYLAWLGIDVLAHKQLSVETLERLAPVFGFLYKASWVVAALWVLCLVLRVFGVVSVTLPAVQKFQLPFVHIGFKPVSLEVLGRIPPVVFKILAWVSVISGVTMLVHILGFAAALPELGTVMPYLHKVFDLCLIWGPVYLYVSRIVRKDDTENGAWVWFCKLAAPHWVSGDGVERLKAYAYLVPIVIFIWVVGQLNSTLQDAYAAMTNVAVAKDQAGTYAAMWEMIKVFTFALIFLPFNTWLRRRAYFHWRQTLTNHFLNLYLSARRMYLAVAGREDIDNPDERIHEDCQEFTAKTYGLVLAGADAFLTLYIFAYKLYGISLALSVASIIYALVGTVVMYLCTKRLIEFSINEKRLEANFRYYLIFIRIMAEPIAFFRGHKTEKEEVQRRFTRILDNFNKVNAWQRNLEHFTRGYGYLDQFVVWAIVLPAYFAGTIAWGDVQGAQMAFAMVLGSLSLFVNEAVTYSRLTAVTKRAGFFHEVLNEPEFDPNKPHVKTVEVPGSRELKFDNVTVVTPRHNNKLAENVSVTVSPTNRVIVVGPRGSGKSSLIRIGGGLWNSGSGTVTRPPLEDFMFLPQRPLLNVGRLRDQILYPHLDVKISDAEIEEILAEVGLPKLTKQFPQGLDTLQEHISWGDVLSPGQQQCISFARVLVHKDKVKIAVLDEASASLDVKTERRLYGRLKELGIPYMSVGHRPTLVHYHDEVIEILGDGSFGWRSMTPAEYEQKQKDEAEKDN